MVGRLRQRDRRPGASTTATVSRRSSSSGVLPRQGTTAQCRAAPESCGTCSDGPYKSRKVAADPPRLSLTLSLRSAQSQSQHAAAHLGEPVTRTARAILVRGARSGRGRAIPCVQNARHRVHVPPPPLSVSDQLRWHASAGSPPSAAWRPTHALERLDRRHHQRQAA
jgi:hypothetical protein